MTECPICGYALGVCQCLYAGTAHPKRHDKRQVVQDHLYLLSDEELKHVINLQKHWQTSYGDELRTLMLHELELKAKLRKEKS